VLDRIAEFIARHAMFEIGQHVGVAVSGGADSVFLLHALHELAPRWNLKLSVVHLEHGIRGAASLADAGFVRGLAAQFALPFHLGSVNIPAAGGNLEQAARNARLDFFGQLMGAQTLDRIATGHTLNDQAETVLYRILRGAGLTGIAGILPVTAQGMVRPLLEVRRSEIETWLRERAIEWRDDQTNQDLAYARNRLRHEILPLLRQTFNPGLDQALCHLATLAQDEERYWKAELDDELPWPSECRPVLSASELASLLPAKARRLVRRAVEHAKGDLRQIDFDHIERILDLARSTQGHGRLQLPGVEVLRSFEWIRLTPAGCPNGPKPAFSLPLQVPGSVELPGSSARITLQLLEKPDRREAYATVVNDLDWQRVSCRVPYRLELRAWRPGDQYRPVGQSKQDKVKVLFQEARVPLWERANWPIITYNGIILWARRFGAAAEFAANPDTPVVLRVDESVSGLSNQSD